MRVPPLAVESAVRVRAVDLPDQPEGAPALEALYRGSGAESQGRRR